MSYEIPVELKYSKQHEWLRQDSDGHYTVGISDYAQQILGDMVFIDLPETGLSVTAGEDCAVVESVKSASDVYAPVSGEIIAVNSALNDAPELINSSPYEAGWIFKMKIHDPATIETLLDAAAYRALIESE